MRAAEAAEVDALLRAAFPGPEEAGLVRALRASGEMVAEMVLPWEGRIAAYAGISRMRAPANWFCLAPVAVWPAWQRGASGRETGGPEPHHFGSGLLRRIAEAWSGPDPGRIFALGEGREGDGPRTLVVLGKPSFYARAGFSRERAARVRTPFSVEHTLILRPGTDVPEVELSYPTAFDGLG